MYGNVIYFSSASVIVSLSTYVHTEGPAGMELNVGSAPARTSILSHTGLTLTESGSEPPLVSDVMLEMCEGIDQCTCVHICTPHRVWCMPVLRSSAFDFFIHSHVHVVMYSSPYPVEVWASLHCAPWILCVLIIKEQVLCTLCFCVPL